MSINIFIPFLCTYPSHTYHDRDIDLLLSEEERLPCVFAIEAKYLGHLDTSSSMVAERQDLSAKSKIEMPIWMAQPLSDKRMIEVQNPKHYGARMRNEIFAGPNSIKYRDYSYYFFEAGLRLAALKKKPEDKADRDDLVRFLRFAFSGERYTELINRALSNSQGDVIAYSQRLTATELMIFNEGQVASNDLFRWRIGQSARLEASSLLGKGRTRGDFDEAEGKRNKSG
jgi:GINS complex protein